MKSILHTALIIPKSNAQKSEPRDFNVVIFSNRLREYF